MTSKSLSLALLRRVCRCHLQIKPSHTSLLFHHYVTLGTMHCVARNFTKLGIFVWIFFFVESWHFSRPLKFESVLFMKLEWNNRCYCWVLFVFWGLDYICKFVNLSGVIFYFILDQMVLWFLDYIIDAYVPLMEGLMQRSFFSLGDEIRMFIYKLSFLIQ